MRRVWRWISVLAVVLLFATAAGAALPYVGFEFLPPHKAQRPRAELDDTLRRAVDASLEKANIASVADARDWALSVTDKLLRFGLDHPTNLSFTASEREAHCVEYAHLFARIFERAVAKAGLAARVWVVHSGKARLFGQKVPWKGWDDHDWVLIEDRTGGEVRRLHVDPTLHDAGLGWDVGASVKGAVTTPP
jgi:hypothetical protein